MKTFYCWAWIRLSGKENLTSNNIRETKKSFYHKTLKTIKINSLNDLCLSTPACQWIVFAFIGFAVFNAANKADLLFYLKPKAVIRHGADPEKRVPRIELFSPHLMYRQRFIPSAASTSAQKSFAALQPHHPPGERTGTSGILNQSQAGA